MSVLEKQIEKKLVDEVDLRGGMCLKWVCPGHAGVPDRILLLPGGRVIFVETKRPSGGRVDERQKWWQRHLTLMGFDAFIVADELDIKVLERELDRVEEVTP